MAEKPPLEPEVPAPAVSRKPSARAPAEQIAEQQQQQQQQHEQQAADARLQESEEFIELLTLENPTAAPRVTRVPSRQHKSAFARWWLQNISIKVPMAKARDNLALERTYLAYLRTSLALSFAGITIAQLFKLSNHEAAAGLGAGFVASSIVVMLCGTYRWWRWQSGMVDGKALAGGWELGIVGAVCVALVVASLVVNVTE